jgi:phosphoglycerate dehydrogenase-like enzyme
MKDPIHVLVTLELNADQQAQIQAVSDRVLLTVHPARKAKEVPEEIWLPTQALFTFNAMPKPEAVPGLKWLHFYFAGIDSIIDHPLLAKEGLRVTGMSGANASQVAEHALALMLGLGRRIPMLYDLQIRNRWLMDRESYQPRPLSGSTVGIVGYGSIGREIARLLQPFGVTILATKRDVMHPEDTGYTPEGLGDPGGDLFNRLYPPEAIRSMLSECDYVVVTTPLTPETRGLIDSTHFEAMIDGAIIVDVSRGGVIDHDALFDALEAKKLGGVGLDVFPEEPLPADNFLWEMPNVILTPHLAGISPHYLQQGVDLFAINLERYLSGETLFNRIDLKKGY